MAQTYGFRLGSVLVAASVILALPALSWAQSTAPPPVKRTAKSGTPTAPPSQQQSVTEGKPTGGDAGLKARVEQLEEQLVDLQVTIGTLESLAKSAGSASSSATYRAGGSGGAATSSADGARVEQLDVQMRALVQQVEQLAERVRSLEGASRGAGRPSTAVAPAAGGTGTGFGTTVVTPAGTGAGGTRPVDSIGQVIQAEGRAPPSKQVAAADGGAAPPAGSSPSNPKALYEQAYGFLLAQDYAAAETAFADFLQRYPSDTLAGNAQYWLGETHFFRGQFKAAAEAYYKGYQTYGRSVKAPDSLLKLALSLDKLGQREAACQSFSELTIKFPNASPQIKSRAQSEAQRLSCQ